MCSFNAENSLIQMDLEERLSVSKENKKESAIVELMMAFRFEKTEKLSNAIFNNYRLVITYDFFCLYI